MSTIELTITREDDEDSRDVTVTVAYTRSGCGIDYAVEDGIALSPSEEDALFAAIVENEAER
jgi:hypothetical protein